ncbi:MAG: PDZ domain-containing protein [Candidatus Omnitrophica bacterium]|nr:PDZ domain-containing protein [Candidatus Omnitrophota bacterium]
MKTIRRAFLAMIAVLSFICLAEEAPADTIIMHDGKEIKGIVVEDYKDRIVFSTADGEITVMKSDVRQLSFDSEEENLVKLAEQAADRRDYDRAMGYYEMALKARPDFPSARQGMVFLRGSIFRKEESMKFDDIKRREEIEEYGGAGQGRAAAEELKDMEKILARSIGIAISLQGNMPEIITVDLGSPAQEAGLKRGDILVSVWDKLTGYMSLEEILELILERSALEIQCVIQRDITAPIRGVSLAMELEGLTIADIKRDSRAEAAGLKKGDLIVAINDQKTRYMPLKKAIELIKNTEEDSVKLRILRDITIWRRGEL